MSKRPLPFGPLSSAPVPARLAASRSASVLRSAKPALPPHAATVQRARSKPMALVAQRMEIDSPNVDTCVHCQEFLYAPSLYETETIKVTKTIFKSSLYLLRKQHRVTDGLDEAVEHLHESVAIAEKLAIRGTTHVVMHVTKKKNKGFNDSYAGYEHFHSFIVFDPNEEQLERRYQLPSPRDWAKEKSIGVGLWGRVHSQVEYREGTPYGLGVQGEYEENNIDSPGGLYPVFFEVAFKNGKATTIEWAF